MIATARRQPEGSLIYVIDKADLYLRVRYGLRQVMVVIHFFTQAIVYESIVSDLKVFSLFLSPFSLETTVPSSEIW